MALNTTRGGLQPAVLVNLSTQEEVRCMFNPHEYTLTKANQWERKPSKGRNIPVTRFRQGGPQVLRLKLHFDTYAEGADVRQFTDPIWRMMMVDPERRDPRTGKSEPPTVAFRWGKLDFRAVITDLNQKFTLFLEDGTPVRAVVDITLEQVVDEEEVEPQTPTLLERVIRGVRRVVAGERLDTVAAEEFGDPSAWRQIAEASGIDNPMDMRSGADLVIPSRD